MNQHLKTITLMVGLPQSGKSSEARLMKMPIVNRDSIRKTICGDMRDHSQEPFVTKIERIMVESLFNAGHTDVVVDSCNHTKRGRNQWKKWANKRYIKIYPFNVMTSLETCLSRAKRNFPDEPQFLDVIKRMWEKSDMDIGQIPEKQSDNWN